MKHNPLPRPTIKLAKNPNTLTPPPIQKFAVNVSENNEGIEHQS
jgi:hypothetical protein